jgi:hypothetical protein
MAVPAGGLGIDTTRRTNQAATKLDNYQTNEGQ